MCKHLAFALRERQCIIRAATGESTVFANQQRSELRREDRLSYCCALERVAKLLRSGRLQQVAHCSGCHGVKNIAFRFRHCQDDHRDFTANLLGNCNPSTTGHVKVAEQHVGHHRPDCSNC